MTLTRGVALDFQVFHVGACGMALASGAAMRQLLCASFAVIAASSLLACTNEDPPPSEVAGAGQQDSGTEGGKGNGGGANDVDAGTLPDGGPLPTSAKPANVGNVAVVTYDGHADDLLTAGLGKSGLASSTAPGYAHADTPTAAELRKNAIWANYRALVDSTAGGGFGTLYGPNVAIDGSVTQGEGKVAGKEYIALIDDGSGKKNVTLMAQIPATFDRKKPCVITGASSGSRGIYGAIATSGEWGLKHGCAVAYTDKGTGNGLHDLEHDTVGLIDGTRESTSAAAGKATFAADAPAGGMSTFLTKSPHRVAYKHAHSGQNPEKDWGKDTLDAISFTLWALNDALAPSDGKGGHVAEFRADNALVVASSVSNGGGAALAAAEQDSAGLIDAVVVGEPQVQVAPEGLSVVFGGQTETAVGKPLYDYLSYANLFQLCASLAPNASPSGTLAAADNTLATARCASLHTKGLLTSLLTADQAKEALQKLVDYGFPDENPELMASHVDVTMPVVVAYANAYGRFSAFDAVCGLSYGAVDSTGVPVALPPASALTSFAVGNGVPTTSGISIVYDLAYGGAKTLKSATSPTTFMQDRALDADLCLRSLYTGTDPVTTFALMGDTLAKSNKVRTGIAEVQRTGALSGKPTIIVQGRSDTLLPVNHTGRAYVAKNHAVEPGTTLRYYEVTNAQHLDVLAGVAGLDTRIVPLTLTFNEALDAMYAHLGSGGVLPPSQVVRTAPRGGSAGSAPTLTRTNVPKLSQSPSSADAIVFSGTALTIPK